MAQNRPSRERSDFPDTAGSFADTIFGRVARIAGLALLVVGLWTAIAIIREAWVIYNEPRNPRIEAFARAIEAGTHLDALLDVDPPRTSTDQRQQEGETSGAIDSLRGGATPSKQPFRFSYFLAWGFVFVMLLLLSRLAIAAIKTGADLALYDVQIRRLRQDLMREIGRERDRSP